MHESCLYQLRVENLAWDQRQYCWGFGWAQASYHIEEWEVVPLNAQICNLLPLLASGVDAGGVVRAACAARTGIFALSAVWWGMAA